MLIHTLFLCLAITYLIIEFYPRCESKKPIKKTVIYSIIIALVFLIISFEPFGVETNLTAAISCFNNVGPGLGAIGPNGSYADYSAFSKVVLSFAMLFGRLEIFPLLLACNPKTWIKK